METKNTPVLTKNKLDQVRDLTAMISDPRQWVQNEWTQRIALELRCILDSPVEPAPYCTCPGDYPNHCGHHMDCAIYKDPDDAPVLEHFPKDGIWKIGGKVVSEEEGKAAFQAALKSDES